MGIAVIDSFTHYVLEFMEGINKTSQASMQDLVRTLSCLISQILTMCLQFNSYDFNKIYSHAGVRSDLYSRPLDRALITDFFGGVAQVEVLPPSAEEQAPSCLEDALTTGETEDTIAERPKKSSHHVQRHSPQASERSLPLSNTISGMLRAWGSVGLVGVLVGWVAVRS